MSDIINNIDYQGNLTIKVMRNSKIIKQYELKNKGRWPLFKFLTQCLAGNYQEIENYRPKYLKLFSIPYNLIKNDNCAVPNITNSSESGEFLSKCFTANNILTTVTIPMATKPEVISETESCLGSSYIKYTFNIPASYINFKEADLNSDSNGGNGWAATDYKFSPINLIALYCNEFYPGYMTNITEPSAFAFIQEAGKFSDLLGKDWNDWTNINQYHIIIDWKLNIGNPVLESNKA